MGPFTGNSSKCSEGLIRIPTVTAAATVKSEIRIIQLSAKIAHFNPLKAEGKSKQMIGRIQY
jgi:hypothetical protein